MLQSCHTSRAISFVISITFNCQPLIEHRVSDLQLFRNSRHLLLPSVLQLCKKQTFSYYPTYDSPLRNVYIFNVSQIARISDRRVKRSSLDRRGERERESRLRTYERSPPVRVYRRRLLFSTANQRILSGKKAIFSGRFVTKLFLPRRDRLLKFLVVDEKGRRKEREEEEEEEKRKRKDKRRRIICRRDIANQFAIKFRGHVRKTRPPAIEQAG